MALYFLFFMVLFVFGRLPSIFFQVDFSFRNGYPFGFEQGLLCIQPSKSEVGRKASLCIHYAMAGYAALAWITMQCISYCPTVFFAGYELGYLQIGGYAAWWYLFYDSVYGLAE